MNALTLPAASNDNGPETLPASAIRTGVRLYLESARKNVEFARSHIPLTASPHIDAALERAATNLERLAEVIAELEHEAPTQRQPDPALYLVRGGR